MYQRNWDAPERTRSSVTTLPTKKIIEIDADLFATNVHSAAHSFWIDADHLVVTASQEGAESGAREEKRRSRVAVIDAASRSVQYVADDAEIIDGTFNRETRSFFVGLRCPVRPSAAGSIATAAHTFHRLREITVDEEGKLAGVKHYPAGGNPPTPPVAPAGAFKALEHGRGGYLVKGLAAGDTYARQAERAINEDEPLPTIWVRPGHSAMTLPVRYDEIGSTEYVGFLDKYLLNDYDTSATPWTNREMRGGWKRPYAFTPFRLLDRDGGIHEIPYPEFVFDYEIAKRGWRPGRGSNFNRFMLTKPGIVIQKRRENGSALYLFKDDELYLFAHSIDGFHGAQVSPDGWRVAYSHHNEAATGGKYAPRVFSIVDLRSCFVLEGATKTVPMKALNER
jgi:hypothetical protein